MPPFESLRAPGPWRLRSSTTTPTTPQPSAESAEPPSPPRPRFRLRKRAALSQLHAPTAHFLASVAAADTPVPSIEEPQVYDEAADDDMLSIAYPVIPHLDHINHLTIGEQLSRDRVFSQPKTPVPGCAPSLSPKLFPDWSIDAPFGSLESSSSPDYESSRPSTARSTQTSSSLFSRFSLASEELSDCASPESEQCDQFGQFLLPGDTDKTIRPVSTPLRSVKSRKAPWTKAMSQHLWSTYTMYLQDPKVTPFRIGKSGIPPSGVCMRVAREAKRSWKGSRPSSKLGSRGGSSTPTAESAIPYIEWPHTCAATRGHLRDLCKTHNGSATRNLQYTPNNPLPFGKTTRGLWSRSSVPAHSSSAFSGSDMAMSLAVSTSDSMQLQGPLAQLTRSQPEARSEPASEEPQYPSNPLIGASEALPRLGSPFTARSYGPSSSSGVTEGISARPEAQRQARTVGTRRGLRSPVRLDQNRPSIQKRRSRQSVLEPRRIKRPSLGSDFWTDPSGSEEQDRAGQLVEFSSTDSRHRDNLFVPRTNIQELFEASNPGGGPLTGSASFPTAAAALTLASAQTVPARLGSPFSVKTTSRSFPNRHSSVSAIDLDAVFRPFATIHQHGEKAAPSNSTNAQPHTGSLTYIDERLKDLKRRGQNSRRSQSPF